MESTATAEPTSPNVRGKVVERARARELRAQGKTYPEIARALGVSKSSVSLWVRDLPHPPRPGLQRDNWARRFSADERAGLAVELWRRGKSRADIRRALGLDDHELSCILAAVGPADVPRRTRRSPYLPQAARALRSAGWTHSEIAHELNISTSSSSLWTGDIGRADDDEPRARRWNSMVRRRADLRRRQQKLDAANSLPPVTREQLIVAAVIAYWCEGSKDKPYARRESLKFCNSDVRLIQLWLRFLNEMGVGAERLRCRVQIHETADVEAARVHWAEVTGLQRELIKVTLKRHVGTGSRRNVGDGYRGCLTVHVTKGANLYRHIDAWFQAIVAGALRLPVETRELDDVTDWTISSLDRSAMV